MDKVKEDSQFNAWHPGLESEIPSELLPLVTLFRPENSTVSYAEAKELAQISGLDEVDLVSFHSERLVIHELLIRVTADLSIPDGPQYAELGINLRTAVATILEKYVRPQMTLVDDACCQVRSQAGAFIEQQLASQIFERDADKIGNKQKTSLFSKIFGGSSAKTKKKTQTELPEIAAIAYWQRQLEISQDPLEKACFGGLVKVAGCIVGHRGRIIADKEMITRLATNFVCNTYGSEKIGETIVPMMAQAIEKEGYRVLPAQEFPVVMNVKGASASGKSTIRPQQRQFAEKIGISWQDFALISPDYWRKYLLNYDDLGEHYKYAAMLTGQELEIIDKKLDRYMADKAARQMISHLLIDRFRFDSFALGEDGSSGSKLLSRFGDRIYMFFLVTPPVETIERAWQRGKQTGRYKAVDDLLYHNIEAFTGMPQLFFSWVLSVDKRVHYEFLDNDVDAGQVPRTLAFGWNNTMTILDVKLIIDIERFRKVNIEAASPQEVFNLEDMNVEKNVEFLQRCAAKIPEILFADQSSAYIYARVMDAELVWCDRDYIKKQYAHSCVEVALEALGYDESCSDAKPLEPGQSTHVGDQKKFTLGRWNEG